MTHTIVDRGPMKRNVALLSACLALSTTGVTVTAVVSALAGKMLAPDGMWTLPLALQFIGMTVMAIPANTIMNWIGRRAGFTLGQLIGIGGAFLSYYAIIELDYELLCVGGLLLGFHNAFWNGFRFAATETATESFKNKAISYVLAGGVISAIIGPEIAKFSKDLMAPATYAGSYLVIVLLCCITIAILQFIRIPRPKRHELKDTGRPLGQIIKQPTFIAAALAAAIGYGSMSLIMTATMPAMEICGFGFDESAFVIQWHAIAMFAPNFFTGSLIQRFGVLNVITTGIVLMFACIAVNLSGIEYLQFLSGLVALGLAWNFMFVGGTTLLTECYRSEERFKVQGLNDFIVYGMMSLSSLSSGILLQKFGWVAVNTAVILPILVVTGVMIWVRVLRNRQARSLSAAE
ncbi:MFS transporter [Aestuariispira ectoiniformans]|uniref:MFS transporter n=1 Tax=Aestuariispira ectoiniformans TaxID=2775080 RepID=UPI00223B7940|nr:MFS transporter [Aestuariispira ectoiniformans]